MKTQESNFTETFTGLRFDFLDPQCDQISIFDIARALSMQCRYNGQCRRFFSIAEHSLLVSSQCADENKLYGLLHDAAEAYLSDIPSPIKAMLPDYRRLEDIIQNKINQTFCVDVINKQEIKYYDLEVLRVEARALIPSGGADWLVNRNNNNPLLDIEIKCLSPEIAERDFINKFFELKGKIENAIK